MLLETDERKIDGMPGAVLAEAIQGLAQPPRMVALAACQSAGTGHTTDSRAHLALGPALIRSGAPAVIAMNGKITQTTAAEFYPCFFAELLTHGAVDRAVSTARRKVRALARQDWWMPVLYMRLSAGRIWSVLHVRDREKQPYEELSLSLQNEQCTPIIGPGLLEALWGPVSAIAREWAERRGFPLSPHRTAELPTVAQFLARRRGGSIDRNFVLNTWLQSMETVLTKRWPAQAGAIPGLAGLPPARRVSRLVSAAGEQMRKSPTDPYSLLARLPVSIYLTATPDPLLADALRAATPPRDPIVDYVRWTDKLKQKQRVFDENDRSSAISRDRPLVYHLFGTLEERDSLVLTEDDFFDYLISVVKDHNGTVVPTEVRNAWSTSALMLLGFDLDDWTFRALYRVILQEQGHKLRQLQGPLSAAVQINPEEERNLRPDLALEYLEQVFESDRISLSWSPPAEFLREVWQRLPAAFGGPP